MLKYSSFARRCSIERLEDRRLMAGDVSARIVNGNLVVRGDDAANSIIVAHAPTNANEFYVQGVNDANGVATRVNGTANGATTFRGFNGRIDIQLKGGNDSIVMAGIICRGLSVDLGSGNDQFVEYSLTVNGDLCFNAAGGDDHVEFKTADTSGSLKVNLGDGNNSFLMEHATVGQRGDFKSGRGNDSFRWLDVAFDSIVVDLGDGANTLDFDSCTVNRDAQFTTGNGADSATIVQSTVNGNLRLFLDGGNCQTTGSGNDTCQISSSKVIGNTSANLGDGDNGYFTLQHSTFQGDVTFQGGKGTDFLVLYDIHVLRSLKANFGGGTNQTSVLGITVDGRADFIGGSGVDSFEIVGITAASLNVAMGKGNDTLKLGFSTTTQSTRIDGEDGQDTYLVGDSGTNTLASISSRSFETLGTFHPA